jgi:LPS export ABC transporter protein LptC
MKTLKYLSIFLILLITTTAGVFLYQWMGKEIRPFRIPKITSDLKIEEVRLTRAIEGRIEWELRAKSADYFREKGITHLELPEVVFYGKGDKRIELKGEKGEVYSDTNDVAVSGNVRIVTSDGYSFQSDYLRYSSQKRVVTTESRVIVKGKGLDMEGTGMLADIEHDRIFIKKGVKAVLEGKIK